MKTLFIDIETSPNQVHCWGIHQQNIGINQIINSSYTLCFAAKWADSSDIIFSSVYKDGKKKMAKLAHCLLNEADVVVTYYGSRFDVPTLNKEFLLLGLTPPAPYAQVDLLKTARKQFKFPSNKLDYVAQALGLGAKVQHRGHALWIGCMNNDAACWTEMEAYNIQDVVLLEKVYERLLPWIGNHPALGLYDSDVVGGCNNCGSTRLQRRGLARTKTRAYQRYQCRDCGSWMRTAKMTKDASPDYRTLSP